MRHCFFIIVITFMGLWHTAPVFARTKVVSIEYVYQIPDNVSQDQAKEIAISMAREQAIADEFGTSVSQVNSIYIDNINGRSNTDFMALGGGELRGEWIEDIDSPIFEYTTVGGQKALKVRLKGRIQESKISKIPIDVKILSNGISNRYESENFTSGDALYVSLSSPVNGYAAIYLLDKDDNAFCLLPYQSQNDIIFKIKANKKYCLFNRAYPGTMRAEEIDELIVYTESVSERNRIVTIFSPNRFTKGVDTRQAQYLPRAMAQSDFRKWVSDLVKRDPELTIVTRPIIISKKK